MTKLSSKHLTKQTWIIFHPEISSIDNRKIYSVPWIGNFSYKSHLLIHRPFLAPPIRGATRTGRSSQEGLYGVWMTKLILLEQRCILFFPVDGTFEHSLCYCGCTSSPSPWSSCLHTQSNSTPTDTASGRSLVSKSASCTVSVLLTSPERVRHSKILNNPQDFK